MDGGTEPEGLEEPIVFNRFVAYRLARANARLNAQASRILQDFDLTLTQWRILTLIRNEGAGTLSAIADVSSIDKGLLSRNLNSMIEGGLISQVVDGVDRRRKRLSLTDEGLALHRRILPVMKRRHAHLVRDLSDAEIATLLKSLDLLEAASVRTDFLKDEE